MSSRKLTQEQKDERARKRNEADERMKANAPFWSMITDACPDENRVRYVEVESGAGSTDLTITAIFPGGSGRETLHRHMTLEDWAELADAALRRVKWLSDQLKELDLDETVLAAMGRRKDESK